MDSYPTLLKKNWEYRFMKFEQSILSWTSRTLNSVTQRIEVIKIYALSRIYYVASVIPLSKTLVKKFEKSIRKFNWLHSGKLLRISFSDLKHPLSKGGLGLVCLNGMSRSLRLNQLVRLLKSEDPKSINHVTYWIGDCCDDYLPDGLLAVARRSNIVPPFFQSLAELLCDARLEDVISLTNWRILTNKMVYKHHVSKLPPLKLEQDLGVSLQNVWRKMLSPAIDTIVRERLYFLVHNKLPTRERLFRFFQ